MDLERQPLLVPSSTDARNRNRPLTHEQVKESSFGLPWRRLRVLLVVMLWVTMAMFISIAVCMLINARPCANELGPGPTVPPAHLTFAPLISRARVLNNVYAA